MINFALTDEQRQFQSLARQFTKEVIIPCAAKYDREERYPEEVVRQAHELGLLNTLPKPPPSPTLSPKPTHRTWRLT